MEQAGRILRAQARRKQVFLAILPLLTAGLIRPAEGKRPAQKDYRVIKEQVRQLRAELADADAFMAMTNVVEQACNRYLQTEAFPATYEDMQPVPVLSVGQLTFAGDDGHRPGERGPLVRPARCAISDERLCESTPSASAGRTQPGGLLLVL